MKKPLLYIGLLLVIIIIIGIVVANNSASPSDNTNGNATTTTEVKPLVQITALAKSVQFKENNSDELKSIENSATTTSGATVKTSSSGRALIEDSEKRLVIDYDTEMTINVATAKGTSVDLVKGSIWSRIQKIFEKGEYYEVKTQNTVAAVRGTTFSVSYLNNETTVYVIESTVAVTPLDPITGKPLTDKTVLVPAGMKATNKNGVIVVTEITDADRNSGWLKYNDPEGAKKNPPATDPKKIPTTPVPTPKTPTPSPKPTTTQPPAPTVTTPPSSTTPEPTTGLSIKSVSPVRVQAGSGQSMTITGSGFTDVIAVAIGEYEINPTEVTNFRIVSNTTITFTLPQEVQPGLHDITVVSKLDEGATLHKSLTVY